MRPNGTNKNCLLDIQKNAMKICNEAFFLLEVDKGFVLHFEEKKALIKELLEEIESDINIINTSDN